MLKNHVKNSVVYTGTHDTDTVRGWFTHEALSKEKHNLFELLGRKVGAKTVSFELVKAALASVADLSLVPLQDISGLGGEARMNNPGSSEHNWEWRILPKQLNSKTLDQLAEVTAECHRA
jgi:4-alpha-glucanotransferase